MEESKTYHEKHISLKTDDPEPYYWVGVIDWSLAYRGNKDIARNTTAPPRRPSRTAIRCRRSWPRSSLPSSARPSIEGITNLQKAIELKPDYDDAMAYLNLLYRQKADMETSAEARDTDLKNADDLVDKVKAIKQKKMENPQQPTS